MVVLGTEGDLNLPAVLRVKRQFKLGECWWCGRSWPEWFCGWGIMACSASDMLY